VKRLFAFLGLALVCMMVVAPMGMALAESVSEGAGAMFDWGTLATVSGVTAATLLIVQYLKVPLDRVWKVPTRIVVLLVALGILILAQAFTVGLTFAGVPLIIVNAFVVALAAMGSYEVAFAQRAQAKPPGGVDQ
jgi:hypothetical protein